MTQNKRGNTHLTNILHIKEKFDYENFHRGRVIRSFATCVAIVGPFSSDGGGVGVSEGEQRKGTVERLM